MQCVDKTLYTGITTDIDRRLKQHNTDNKLGAKYTRNRRPVNIVFFEQVLNRSAAAKREWQLKKMSRQDKLALISTQSVVEP